MGLDLWFRADVARILQATHEAMCSTAAVMADAIAQGNRTDDVAGRERAAGYRQGFGAALRAVAMAFGLADGAPGGSPDRWQVVVGAPEVGPSRMVVNGELVDMVGREPRVRRGDSFLAGSD
jgi:hypothetical protein